MTLTRRALSAGLLAPLGPVARAQSGAQREESPARRRARKIFKEVAASLYAWDLLDEGCERIMETLKETAQVNSLYLVALMHHEKRPLTDFYYPHHPNRKTYFPEDSRVYWHPHPENYRDSRIKPLTSDRDELKKTDWLELLVKAARKAGWKTGAEISHPVLDKQRAAEQFVSVVQRDIHGNPLGQQICPNKPDAFAYLTELFTDVVKNYDVDFIQTCLIPFSAGGRGRARATNFRDLVLEAVLGSCACESCVSAAKADGLDLKAALRAMLPLANALSGRGELVDQHRLALLRASNTSVTALLVQHPEILDWAKFRCSSMTRLFGRLHKAVAAINPKVDLRLNAYIYDNWELSGIDFAALRPHLGSIRSSRSESTR